MIQVPRVRVMKHFKAILNSVLQKAGAFVTVSHFYPSLTFCEAGAYPSGDSYRTTLRVRSLTVKIRLGWMRLVVTTR
jgi:hypothetical protein